MDRSGIFSKEHLSTAAYSVYNKCLPHFSCFECDLKQEKLFQYFDVLADCEGPWLYGPQPPPSPPFYLKKLVTEKLKCKKGTLSLSVFFISFVLVYLTYSDQYVGDIAVLLWKSTVLSELQFTTLERLGTQSVFKEMASTFLSLHITLQYF